MLWLPRCPLKHPTQIQSALGGPETVAYASRLYFVFDVNACVRRTKYTRDAYGRRRRTLPRKQAPPPGALWRRDERISKSTRLQKVSRCRFHLAAIGFCELEPSGWKRCLIGAEAKEIGIDRLADN